MTSPGDEHYMDSSARLPLHYESLDRTVELTFAADAKAGFFLALHIVMISTIASQLSSLVDEVQAGEAGGVTLVAFGFGLVAMVINVIAVVLATIVVFPRLSDDRSGIVYFLAIADIEYEEFEERATTISSEAHEADVLRSIHAVSRIASKKILALRRAAFLTIVAAIGWLVFIIGAT